MLQLMFTFAMFWNWVWLRTYRNTSQQVRLVQCPLLEPVSTWRRSVALPTLRFVGGSGFLVLLTTWSCLKLLFAYQTSVPIRLQPKGDGAKEIAAIRPVAILPGAISCEADKMYRLIWVIAGLMGRLTLFQFLCDDALQEKHPLQIKG